MPWTETCILDERLAFVAACLRDEESMTALCQHHGISRKTGYKWLARWREDPERGLADRPRVAPPPASPISRDGVPAVSSSLGPVGRATAAVPEVGRNDPCPCGSGRKYKKCHGAGR